MKYPAILCFLLVFALTAFGQTPTPSPKKFPKPAKTVVPKLGSESEEFEKAKSVTDAGARIAALQEFIKNFPESSELTNAHSLIVTARVETGVVKMQSNDLAGGIELYKQAVADAPVPVPDELFSKILIGLPVSLYTINQRGASFDIAKLIEEKVGANANQLNDLAKFYLNVEYGTEAIRLAQKATELAPDSTNAQQTLAAAYRLNFRLEDAANSYAKAIELDSESVIAKLNLAEMKRALGKTDEAAAIYREILVKDAENKAAQVGLTLALFDADKRAEAEIELKKVLEAEPGNSKLLASAAYWYAAHGLNEEAIEYSQKAIAAEPRNVWSYIAQARALTAQKKPLEAEKILLVARAYSDFPTLDYELASVRLAAGLYREAAETLKRSFAVNKEGLVETYLGNRILADAKSFPELLSLERRTAIFEMKSADSTENSERLRALLDFQQKLEDKDATEDQLAAAADEFAKGTDNMRLHRQLFAASRLLQKKSALPKALELTQSAIGATDAALNVANPSAAVLADEIYDSRQYAISQNLVIVVPDIPRQTLSAILRGRIEDIAGLAYFQQNNIPQAIIRLKRALSVLPEKSAFSRASFWHLGDALQADGKEKEALEAYIKGYNKELPDVEKRAFIEALYVKVNGSTDGLDDKVGTKPETTVAKTEPTPTPSEVKVEPSPKIEEAPTPTPKTEETPETKIEPQKLPENIPAIENAKTPESTPSPTPENIEINKAPLSPTPSETIKNEEAKPDETKKEEIKNEESKPEEVKIEPSPSPAPTETPTPETTPTPEIKTEENKPAEISVQPTLEPTPTPQNVSVVISDNLKQIPPSPGNNESKTETALNKTKPQNTSKPIFDPVIISVGKNETPKTETNEQKPSEEKSTEPLAKTETALTETPKKEEPKPAEIKSETNQPENMPADEKILSGELRPRIIITENTGTRTVTEEIATCKLVVNQENLSLLNGGGSLGVMVGFDGEGDFRQISAESSSPEDIEVRLDADIAASQKRAFFIIKSISAKTGAFTVTFSAPCGKKEILVKVR